MTYANGRIINDADSHTMETQDWLAPYLEGEYKEKYTGVYSKREGGERITKMIDAAMARKHDPDARAKAAAHIIDGDKGWLGYGGFDKDERVEALEVLVGVASCPPPERRDAVQVLVGGRRGGGPLS